MTQLWGAGPRQTEPIRSKRLNFPGRSFDSRGGADSKLQLSRRLADRELGQTGPDIHPDDRGLVG